MVEHGEWCDVAKAEIGIFESTQERRIDGGQKLRSESGTEAVIQRDVGEGVVIIANGNGDGRGCACSFGRWARMQRNEEWYTSAKEILGSGKHHGKMAMVAASMSRGHGTRIGVELTL